MIDLNIDSEISPIFPYITGDQNWKKFGLRGALVWKLSNISDM